MLPRCTLGSNRSTPCRRVDHFLSSTRFRVYRGFYLRRISRVRRDGIDGAGKHAKERRTLSSFDAQDTHRLKYSVAFEQPFSDVEAGLASGLNVSRRIGSTTLIVQQIRRTTDRSHQKCARDDGRSHTSWVGTCFTIVKTTSLQCRSTVFKRVTCPSWLFVLFFINFLNKYGALAYTRGGKLLAFHGLATADEISHIYSKFSAAERTKLVKPFSKRMAVLCKVLAMTLTSTFRGSETQKLGHVKFLQTI